MRAFADVCVINYQSFFRRVGKKKRDVSDIEALPVEAKSTTLAHKIKGA
jgi:hypothetical protein